MKQKRFPWAVIIHLLICDESESTGPYNWTVALFFPRAKRKPAASRIFLRRAQNRTGPGPPSEKSSPGTTCSLVSEYDPIEIACHREVLDLNWPLNIKFWERPRQVDIHLIARSRLAAAVVRQYVNHSQSGVEAKNPSSESTVPPSVLQSMHIVLFTLPVLSSTYPLIFLFQSNHKHVKVGGMLWSA